MVITSSILFYFLQILLCLSLMLSSNCCNVKDFLHSGHTKKVIDKLSSTEVLQSRQISLPHIAHLANKSDSAISFPQLSQTLTTSSIVLVPFFCTFFSSGFVNRKFYFKLHLIIFDSFKLFDFF